MSNVKFELKEEKYESVKLFRSEDDGDAYIINGKVWARSYELPIDIAEERKPGSYMNKCAKVVKFYECQHKIGDTAKDPITGKDISFRTEGISYKLADIVC